MPNRIVPKKITFTYLIVALVVSIHLLSQLLVSCQYYQHELNLQQDSNKQHVVESDPTSRIRRQIQEHILKLTQSGILNTNLNFLNSSIAEGNLNTPNTQNQQTSHKSTTNDKFNLIEADENGLYIVGLFDVHQSSPRNPFKCGPIDLDAGEQQSRRSIQNMIAFQWAIEQVNADRMLLPGVHLGSLMMDTCSSFLRTNQQLANLLHESSISPANGESSAHEKLEAKSISPRQMLAIVADNYDWQSVEAAVSMASALGLTTFVTQSKSTKLTDFARKYLPTNQMDYSADARLSETQMERNLKSGESQMQHQFEGFLSELLGIGKMMTTPPASQSFHTHLLLDSNRTDIVNLPLNLDSSISSESASGASGGSGGNQHGSKLLMVKMLLGNELLAESIASLVQQMNWDYLSLIWDDSLDMIDLHDELAKQLFSRNIQLALDEQVPVAIPSSSSLASTSTSKGYDKLLASLAKKSTSGSRVVITLLGTGSSRNLLDSLHRLRQTSKVGSMQSPNQQQVQEQIKQINSLLWITVSDREPYYSFATDALGTIGISSSSSLIPEFKNYYDKLTSGSDLNFPSSTSASGNSNSNNNTKTTNSRWWPEYIKSILLRHKKEVELISNECTKWQEPKLSLLQDQCRALTLSSLVQIEKKATLNGSMNINSASSDGNTNGNKRGKNSQFKLSKYLAGGWEHNGMDVINSVLAIANGLESIRQTLCPETKRGICNRMRELIYPSSPLSMFANEKDIPKLSELIYNELLRSTFQLADGRMFNLDDFNSLGGQVEGKLKLYNLRYLQQNSIGFVKFGHFDQHDGLTLNLTKAKYYPEANFATQLPIDKLKSTCEDETKCLMLQTMQLDGYASGSGSGGQEVDNSGSGSGHDNSTSGRRAASDNRPISEEELAAGVNSLFKLDHPQFVWQSAGVSGGAAAATGGSPTSIDDNNNNNNNGSSVVANQQQPTGEQQVVLTAEDSHVRTMRSPIGFVVGVHHNNQQQQQQLPTGDQASSQAQSSGGQEQLEKSLENRESANSSTLLAPEKSSEQQQVRPMERQTFDTIVLLPLHRGYQSFASVASSPKSSLSLGEVSSNDELKEETICSNRLDASHSFQHLIALAYAQTLANSAELSQAYLSLSGHSRRSDHSTSVLATPNSSAGQPASESNRLQRQRQQIELTTTVIDYCDSIEMAKIKLAKKLSTPSNSSASRSKPVAVIDFDVDVGESVSAQVMDKNLLHITIGLPKAPTTGKRHKDLVKSKSSTTTANGGATVDQRDAMAKQSPQTSGSASATNHLHVSLLPSKSNEIEALVKLLTKLPTATSTPPVADSESSNRSNRWKLVHLIYTDHHHYRDEFVRRANEADICVSKLIWIPAPPQATDFMSQAGSGDGSANASIATINRQQLEKTKQLFANELYDFYGSPKQQAKLDPSFSQDLNATRILVILASENPLTNRMILEAASDSMLDHYVWLTTHEWLTSIELPAELANSVPSSAMSNRLPGNFVSTRLESIETHGFRKFYSQLTPAIHSPLPTAWFDEFWQQHFQCKLPIGSSHHLHQMAGTRDAEKTGGDQHPQSNNAMTPLCQPSQHLDAHHIIEDDRVHYTVRAIESIHFALKSIQATHQNLGDFSSSSENFSRLLANEFKQSFENRTTAPSGSGDHKLKSPFGLHIVHRSLPPVDMVVDGRRANSRNLGPLTSQEQLETVGLWRNGHLILWVQSDGISNRLAVNSNSNTEELDVETRITNSLHQLGQIKSRCVSPRTCHLCRGQIQQTIALVKQEEARLKQSESIDDPKAISSISPIQGQAATSRQPDPELQPPISEIQEDSIVNPTFEELDQNSVDQYATSGSNSTDKQQLDEIQASASSLFNDSTAKEVDRQRQADIRRAYNQMIQQQRENRGLASGQPNSINLMAPNRLASGLLVSLLSLAGIVCVGLSMTWFYPTILLGGTRPKRTESLQSINSSSVYGSKLHIIGGSRSSSPDQMSCDSSLNDYFLLTGLLMLFAINMAVLLPATMGVCYFKRLGLALSYSIIFSSILVKIINLNRKNSNINKQKTNVIQNPYRSDEHAAAAAAAAVEARANIDPIEESVEVTFESLPHTDLNQNTITEGQQVVDVLSNGYQTRASITPPSPPASPSDGFYSNNYHSTSYPAGGTSMTLWISLVLCQLIISIYWLHRQPPEPTLFMGCWHCSSPGRSPIMFAYESLLSLMFPAFLLIISWLCSIYSYKLASKNEEQFRVAVKRLLLANNNVNWQLSSQRQELLDAYLREAKSIIMTTTLLILTWSLITLKLISQQQKQHYQQQQDYQNTNRKPFFPQQNSPDQLQSSTNVYSSNINSSYCNDFTLVYANIISGTLIFVFLFIYRFQLFGLIGSIVCCRRHRRGTKKFISTSGDGNPQVGNKSQVVKFNQSSNQVNNHGYVNKWAQPHQEAEAGDLTLFSQANNDHHSPSSPSRRRERLKLQQFNSSYGTYSFNANATSGTIETHPPPATSGSKKLKMSKSSKSKSVTPTGGRKLEELGAADGDSNIYQSNNKRVQRRQSNNSNASSAARLVSSSNFLDPEDSMFMDLDTISCASSVASSSTSQLHGNDLYPIDCSLQLESSVNNASSMAEYQQVSLNRSASSFNRRSLRRSSMNQKLSLVREDREVVDFKVPEDSL